MKFMKFTPFIHFRERLIAVFSPLSLEEASTQINVSM
jgi:hypothetical protein